MSVSSSDYFLAYIELEDFETAHRIAVREAPVDEGAAMWARNIKPNGTFDIHGFVKRQQMYSTAHAAANKENQ